MPIDLLKTKPAGPAGAKDLLGGQTQNPAVKALDQKLGSTFMSGAKGLFGRLQEKAGAGLDEAAGQIVDSIKRYQRGEETLPETALTAAGRGVKGFFDTTTSMLGEFVPQGVSTAVANKFKESPIVKALAPHIQSIAQGEEKGAAEKTVAVLADRLFQWTQAHPRAARNLDNALQVASVIPAEKLAVAGAKTAAKGLELTGSAGRAALEEGGELASRGLGAAATRLEKGATERAATEALDIVAPKLSATEKATALAEGRGTKSVLGKVSIQPSIEDANIAESVKGLVSKSKNPYENIQAIKNDIKSASENVTEALSARPGTFNNSEIKGFLKNVKEKSRVLFGSDKTLEKTYDAVTDEFMRILKEKGNTLKGVMDARKEFDQVIESKFPGLLGNPAGDSLRRNAILDTRRAANEFVQAKLPEGDALKGILQRQTRQFDAVENIAKKAASEVNTGVITRALNKIKDNPAVTALAGVGVGAAATGTILGALGNPAVVTALLATGAYKVGKMVLTSDRVTQFLIDALRAGEKVFKPTERNALEGLLSQFEALGEVKAGMSIKPVKRYTSDAAAREDGYINAAEGNYANREKNMSIKPVGKLKKAASTFDVRRRELLMKGASGAEADQTVVDELAGDLIDNFDELANNGEITDWLDENFNFKDAPQLHRAAEDLVNEFDDLVTNGEVGDWLIALNKKLKK